MNSLFRELDRLLEAARRDESLRRRLLDTRAASDPMARGETRSGR